LNLSHFFNSSEHWSPYGSVPACIVYIGCLGLR
jgi:hypothetical protein